MRSRQIGSTSSTGRTERSRSIASRREPRAPRARPPRRSTNWPFDASQPFTISSGASSRSCLGHQRFCLIGVRHSRWSSRNDTSDWRAAGFVAGARPTGMLTSPKVSDPFQVVRMSSSVDSGTTSFCPDFAVPAPDTRVGTRGQPAAWRIHIGLPTSRLRSVSTNRTIARLWRDAVAADRPGAAYLVQHGDHWHEVTWAEAAERVENIANGLLARGVRKGEAFATLARTTLEWALFDFALAQIGAVGAPIYAEQLAEGRGVRPRPLGVDRRALRGRRSGGEGRGGARLAAASAARPDVRRSSGARGGGRRASRPSIPRRSTTRSQRSTRTTCSRSSTRRARPARRRAA